MDEVARARLAGLTRALLGGCMFVAPRRAARAWIGDEHPSISARAFARGLAGRDMAIGIGVMATIDDEAARGRWLEAAAMSDAADALATVAALRQVGGFKRLFWVMVCASSTVLHLKLAGELE